MRLLLVEDDAMIGEGICQGMRLSGFDPIWVRDGIAAENALKKNAYDGMLLDLGLPSKAGLEILESIRRDGNHIPVLIITARDKVCDRVQSLNVGADDYIMKPFDLDELAARIRAVLRRNADNDPSCLEVGNLSLNQATHEAHLNDKALSLSRNEFALLEVLASSPGRLYSRAQLEEKLYGCTQEISSNTVEVYIHNLRRKLGSAFIKNVRGIGYKLCPEACNTGVALAH